MAAERLLPPVRRVTWCGGDEAQFHFLVLGLEEGAMAEVRVILLPSPPVKACGDWSALKRKRRTLWHHAARNELIACVGEACLKQDHKTLKEMGVPVKNRKKGVWTHRVVILVENTEHAHALGELLPSWVLLDTVPANEPMDDDGEEEAGTPLLSGSIVTWMHAWRNGVEADYLIRATGWRGRIGLGGENSWLKRPARRLTLVDFDDTWDLQAGMDTEARVLEYKEQGLEVMQNEKNFIKT